MFAFLKRTFVVLVGLLLITLFIWYAGPYFAFAGFAPLESEFARLVAIGVVIGFGVLPSSNGRVDGATFPLPFSWKWVWAASDGPLA